ncbi:MAG TPA: HIT family protein [Albitalea sp.]|nr:HIT family protein [Albitalea sp.]
MGCELCDAPGGVLLWSDAQWRVVRVDDAAFPAFYRVIAQHHVAEFSQLLAPERQRCMDLVCAIERTLIEQLHPTKVNLAALGNMVPHLHWHVIARFDWDSHFPQPIWGARQRDVQPSPASRLGVDLSDLDAQVTSALRYTATDPS